MSTKIGVIESRWYDAKKITQRNTTVKPLFDFLSDLHYGNHHAYDYEMVGTCSAFTDALLRVARSRATTVAYVAMHGNSDGLYLHGGEKVSRSMLKNSLLQISKTKGSKLVGLYFGACFFGSHALAEYLFENNAPVVWIAGYKESIDFVSSSGLDLLFFNTMLAVRDKNPSLSNLKEIEEVARRMRKQMQGMCNTPLENGDRHCGLGFSIFVKRRGRSKGAKDLMREF